MRVVGGRWGAIGRVGSRLPLGVVLLLSGVLSGCAQSINITPAHPQIAAGTSAQLTATSLNSDGQPQDVTAQVTWSSSNSAVASVSAGTVSGLTAGSVTISAHLPGASGSTRFTVSPAALVSLQLTPAAPSLPNGLTEQFSATGVFADNSTQDLTQQVSWSSSSPTVAAVSNSPGSNGLASATGVGSSTLTATSGSVSASTTLTVTSATLVSIQVTPATPSTPKGLQQPLTATGIYSDNSTQNLTSQVSWSSSTPAVATISNAAGSQGVASSLAPGSTTISATSGSISGSTVLTVTAATLVSIAITPANRTVATGSNQQFVATGTYTDNSTQALTTQVIWSSSDTHVATISNAIGSDGLASTVAAGSATITATSGNLSGSTTLTVAALIDSANVATDIVDTAASSFSFNVTVAAGDNYLVLTENNNAIKAPPMEAPSSVTFNGQALTLVTSGTETYFEASIWALANPPVGTYSLVVTYPSDYAPSVVRGLYTAVPAAGVTSIGVPGNNVGTLRGPQNLAVTAGSTASNGFYLGICGNYSDGTDSYGAASAALSSNGTGQSTLSNLLVSDPYGTSNTTGNTYASTASIPSPDAADFSWSTGDSLYGWLAIAVAVNGQ